MEKKKKSRRTARLKKPIIESCWDLTPSQRPTAIQVVERLKPLVNRDEKQKLSQPVSSSMEDSPKPGVTADSKDEEMKKLLGEVMRLKLEQEKDKQRILEMEKKAEEQAKRQAELDLRRAEEVKEIQRQPVESKDKLPLTPSKQEQELKKLTPLPSLSGSSQTLMPPPKPTLKPLDQKSLSQLQQLLQYVAEGEQDKAEGLIQTDKNLLLYAGTVKDLSGREFKPITAFQYALWAMDWHMWTMIQKYLPKEAQAEQFQALESKGTAYGKHFNLQGLTGALQTYVDNVDKVWNYDQRAGDHWCKVVGGEQKLLPAHVVNEYCRPDRAFEPCPQEWQAKLPRTREVPEIWDSAQSKYVKGSWWFIPSSSNKDGLGLIYAFLRYKWLQGRGRCQGCDTMSGISPLNGGDSVWKGVCADLKALQSLWKARTQQLELLQSQLSSTASYNQSLGS